MSVEAMKQALEALDDRSSLTKWQTAREALRQAIEQAEKQGQWGASSVTKPEYVAEQKEKTQRALDLMAENARELGLDYEPVQAEKQEPVALKNGECWPEYVMEEWDYWRKQIADGDKGSAPRDWFEELAELKLVTAQPQREWVGLTADEFLEITNSQLDKLSALCLVENKLKEKNT